MRKYNNQTKCYKIDLFINGNYYCSTDMSKTCKQAKINLFNRCNGNSAGYPLNVTLDSITASFYRH